MTRLTWIVLALAASSAYAGPASERSGKPVNLDDEVPKKSGSPAPPPSTKTTKNDTEISCMERENGKYTIGCSDWFVQCHNHITYKYDCPAGLRFDPMLGQCDYASGIKQCSKKELYKGMVIKTPADFSCANRTHGGLYSHPEIPCSKYYYTCAHGNAARMTCPHQQFFNEKEKRCDYQNKVPACQNQKINGMIVAAANLPYGSLAQQEPLGAAPPAPPQPEISNASQIEITETTGLPSCSMNGDGVYPDLNENCANFFFKCANDKLFKYKCQEGLFYDTDAMRCDHKEFVPNCGGVRQVTTAAPAFDPSSIDFDCTGKTDGVYVKEECPSVFYNCNGNVASKTYCSKGLKFDLRRNMCVYPLECGKEDPTTPVPAVIIPGNSIQEDAVTTTTTTEAPIDFDCSNKKDGQYEIALCQKDYVQCANGQPLRASCQSGLVYSSINRRCDYEEDCKKAAESTTPAAVQPEVSQETKTPYDVKIDATSAAPAPVEEISVYSYPSEAPTTTTTTTTTTAAPTTTAATTTTQATILYGSAQVIENAAAAPPVGEVNCANLKNGAFAVAPCSQEYMSCWEGNGHKLSCGRDLYFNPYNSQCDFKINIFDCNPDAPVPQVTSASAADVVIVITTTAAPLPVDDFCKTRKSGFYGIGCSEHFYNCHDGHGAKLSCSNGLFYDEVNNHCNHKAKIVACGATVPPPTTTVAPAIVTTKVPHIVPSIPVDDFCKAKQNGFYGIDCNNFFYSCSGGITYKFPCPEGTFYDVVKKSCLRKEEVAACSAPTTTTTTPATPAQAAPIPGYAFTVAEEPVVIGVFCHDKEDGFHGEGCNAYFYSCHAGTTHKMPCPPGTFYDVDSHSCISKDKIVACGGAPVAAPTVAAVEVAGNTPATPAESFCEQLKDGYYGHGCNNFYFYCSNGATRKLSCPSTLFYDSNDHRCDKKETIEACGAKPTPTVANVAPVAETTPATHVVDPFCERLADGYYGHGCNNFYYYCSNGATRKMSCPPGLFYDSDDNRCNRKETVEACGAKPTPAAAAPETPATLPAKNPYDIPTQAPVVQRHPVSFDCAGKKDGLYNLNECTPIFIQCYNGQTIQNTCQEGLFYNVDNGMCDYAENTAVCKTSLPSTASTTPVPPTTAASPAKRPQVSANATCTGKADGYYSNGCSDVYFSCSSGNLTPLNCGRSTRFDASRTLCDFPENVPECGGSAPTIAPSTPAPVAPAVPEGAAAQQPKEAFSCDSKPDGFYAIGPCTRFYANCVSGNPYVGKCPNDLHYNKEKGLCDYKENVLGCQKIMATVPAVPVTTTTEIPTTVAAPAPPPSLPQRDLPTPCTGKPDGHLALGDCSPEYLSCRAGSTYSFRCQDGLFFNQALNACDYPSNVAGCQKNVAPAPSIAAPAPPPVPQFSLHPVGPMINPGPYGGFPPQQPQQPMDFNCLGKNDGYYGIACDKKYWQCSNQMTYSYTCTSGLIYNGKKGACDYPARIEC